MKSISEAMKEFKVNEKEDSKTDAIKVLNDRLLNFLKPLIHLQKHVRFELKSLAPKHQKEISDLTKELEAVLDKLNLASENALFSKEE